MRYSYTDTRLMMWPFVWVFGVFAAIGKAIAKLFAKRPYEALCELVALDAVGWPASRHRGPSPRQPPGVGADRASRRPRRQPAAGGAVA